MVLIKFNFLSDMSSFFVLGMLLYICSIDSMMWKYFLLEQSQKKKEISV